MLTPYDRSCNRVISAYLGTPHNLGNCTGLTAKIRITGRRYTSRAYHVIAYLGVQS